MATGFAGAQRTGDRRRRRLAVEEQAEGAICARPDRPAQRVDSAHTEPTEGARNHLALPLALLIPIAWWKHALLAFFCGSVGTALVTGGCWASSALAVAGPQFVRLLAPPEAPLARWYSNLLLTLSAELAALIWWARSKSENDFDGRYWLWVRIACLWLAMSGSIDTGAHQLLVAPLSRLWSGPSTRHLLLMTCVGIGAWVIRALSREMSGCRLSRGVLLNGVVGYFAAAVLRLEQPGFVPASARPAVLQASLLWGHISLFLSMCLHARHVLHYTVEPAGGRSSGWRLPRPHLNLARLLPRRRQKASGVDEAEPLQSKATAERRSPVERARHEVADFPPAQPQTTAKPRIRIDTRHDEFSAAPDAEPKAATGSGQRPVASEPPEPSAGPVREPPPVESDPAVSTEDADQIPCELEELGAAEQEPLAKPDMKGLSKKQRRRLMQEYRQRERETER